MIYGVGMKTVRAGRKGESSRAQKTSRNRHGAQAQDIVQPLDAAEDFHFEHGKLVLSSCQAHVYLQDL